MNIADCKETLDKLIPTKYRTKYMRYEMYRRQVRIALAPSALFHTKQATYIVHYTDILSIEPFDNGINVTINRVDYNDAIILFIPIPKQRTNKEHLK